MTFYSNGSVSVDANFARFGDKSYAIDKINSVEVRSRPKSGSGGFWFCMFVAAIAALTFFDEPGVWSAVIAAVFGFAAYACWLEMQKSIYSLYLMTSSSEAQAIATEDRDDVERLRRAIETAMVQGRVAA
jgi:hypothetical protein